MHNGFGISSIGQHNKREAHHFKHPQVLVGVAKGCSYSIPFSFWW